MRGTSVLKNLSILLCIRNDLVKKVIVPTMMNSVMQTAANSGGEDHSMKGCQELASRGDLVFPKISLSATKTETDGRSHLLM
jgi:hypothetical protein